MDYKYIEQLLERFWRCETSLEEEAMLRAFFLQDDLPASMQRYKAFFVYEEKQRELELGDEFDEKVLAQIEKPVVKARRMTVVHRFIPLWKSAALIAVLFSLGAGAQRWFSSDENILDYNYDSYEDTYEDPQVAYEQISTALRMVSESIHKSKAQKIALDSLSKAMDSEEKK